MFWTIKMAWRDSRGSRRQLLLFLSSMAIGVAALVAINSFGVNLEHAVDEQSKELLGADLSLESRHPFAPETKALMDSLGGQKTLRVSFASMAYFPRTEDTRLVTVRALQGDYPYYGILETTPVHAAETYRQGREALIDATLMNQFGVVVGDSVRIGTKSYRVAGALGKTPRESDAMSLFSPRVYIPMEHLDKSLLTAGSRAEYEAYFKFEEGRDVEALVESIEPHLEAFKLGHDTVEEARENWDEGLTNMYRFLSLVAFMAVLLGGVGIGSAVHVYIRHRIETIAVLRCLGARARHTFAVYVVQAGAMGLLGGLVGSLAGVAVQAFVPRVLADFLPVDVTFFVAWRAIALGMAVGVTVTVLFALLPLLAVRRISPLRTLRADVEGEGGGPDVLRWLVVALIAAGVTAFALVQAPDWEIGLGYAGGLAIVFGLLALVARALMSLTRRYFPSGWAYTWRQGLANLYRPNNQTSILMLSLGLGTFLILTLFLSQQTLLGQIRIAGGQDRPNTVLFDIQEDQREGVAELVRERGLTVQDEVPIVTMRLHSVKGQVVDSLRADSTVDLSWAHRREYRSSYRDYLSDTEEIVSGTFVGTMPEGAEVAPISIEQDVAGELNVALGDTLVWDVQGVQIPSVVASVRRVDWQRISTNFFVLFPKGVLEKAPQFFVLLTRADDPAVSAELQSAVVRAYPNVSAIDLSLVLHTVDAIFERISFVVRFMAAFSILTGLIVLVGAVVVSRLQRVEESVLLKTLGASRKQIVRIMVVEYLFLGLFATVTGMILALGAGWALAYFVFEATFVPSLLPLLAAVAVVTAVTIGIGMFNSRGIYDRPPLEVLRAEV